MKDQLLFELLTPEGIKFQEDVCGVMLPTPRGIIGIFPHHTHLITIVSSGVAMIKKQENDLENIWEHVAVAGGIAEIDGRRVRLLCDSAERADAIDELRAQQALDRARELRRTAKDHVSFADAEALIEKNLARIKVAELRRKRTHQAAVFSNRS